MLPKPGRCFEYSIICTFYLCKVKLQCIMIGMLLCLCFTSKLYLLCTSFGGLKWIGQVMWHEIVFVFVYIQKWMQIKLNKNNQKSFTSQVKKGSKSKSINQSIKLLYAAREHKIVHLWKLEWLKVSFAKWYQITSVCIGNVELFTY